MKQNKTPIYYTVKNRMTGDVYETSKSFRKNHIDGIEFTAVYDRSKNRASWIRSDYLQKIKTPEKSST